MTVGGGVGFEAAADGRDGADKLGIEANEDILLGFVGTTSLIKASGTACEYDIVGAVSVSGSRAANRPLGDRSNDPAVGVVRSLTDVADGIGGQRVLATILSHIQPHEVYHLAAQSDVRLSFDQPLVTADAVGMGTLRMLEATRLHRDQSGREVRFYQASSSEMFGNARTSPQDEITPFEPCSPYGIAKLFAHRCAVSYREAYSMYVCCGILFNHESPRRGENFVTRKVTLAAARIKRGVQDKLILGNLDARRDWGFTGDYVQAMWLMMQQDIPADYVIATGRSHSVRELCEFAFSRVGLAYHDFVTTDDRLRRPNEIHLLCGDACKADRELGWRPKVGFESMIHQMVDADLELVDRQIRADGPPTCSLKGDGSHVTA